MRKQKSPRPQQLELGLRKTLVSGRHKGSDPEELFYLQKFRKGKQHPIGYSHAKVVDYCLLENLKLAFGYKIWKYREDKRWIKEIYSFPVVNGKAIDLAKDPKWTEIDIHLIGVIVEPELFRDLAYLKESNLEFFRKRSIFRLYTKDFKPKPILIKKTP